MKDITVSVAADHENHPTLPYIWWDDAPGADRGWVVRYDEAGQQVDQGLLAVDRADEAAAVAEAQEHLTSVAGNAAALAERIRRTG